MPIISTAGWRCSRRPPVEVCTPVAATHFVELARRIAASLELGIAGSQGVLLGKRRKVPAPEAQQEMSDEASHTGHNRYRRYQVAQEPANPFAAAAWCRCCIIGLVLRVGMIAAVMVS